VREIDPEQMRYLESMGRNIGSVLGAAIERRGKKYGFALMLFSFEGPEFTWISNAERATMVKTMQEFINRNPPDQTSEERN
jgi:hypothetical protein